MANKLPCGITGIFSVAVLFTLLPPSLLAAPAPTQTSIVQCTQTECEEPDCANPLILNGECCPVCLQPDLETGGPQSCFYQGVHFSHEEVFHPPSMVRAYMEAGSTGGELDDVENPFCTECTCNDGTTECVNTADECPTLDCAESEAILVDGACCKICPKVDQEQGDGCWDIDGTTWRQAGESWHPVYPGHGMIECVTCACKGEKAVCEDDPTPCPEVPSCGPDDPVEDFVFCCPKCTRGPTVPPNRNSTTSDISPSLTPASTSEFVPSITPCHTDYVIRIYIHSQFDCLALEDTEGNIVETFKWGWDDDGVFVKENQRLTTVQFSQLEDFSSYTPIGWTIPRRVNGLTSRPSKREKIANCTEHCSIMVMNMLRPEETQACS